MNSGWQEAGKSQGKRETGIAAPVATVAVLQEGVGIHAGKQAVPDGRRGNWGGYMTVRVQDHKAGETLKRKEAMSVKNPKQKRV